MRTLVSCMQSATPVCVGRGQFAEDTREVVLQKRTKSRCACGSDSEIWLDDRVGDFDVVERVGGRIVEESNQRLDTRNAYGSDAEICQYIILPTAG
jgi:hypothetical protein